MEIKRLTVVGLGVGGLLLALPARAADEAPVESGIVERVDPGANEVRLLERRTAIAVGADTEIVKNGRSATLADVQEGDEVRASYPVARREPRVQRLEVRSVPDDWSLLHRSHQGP